MNGKVGVVIPVYYGRRFLEETLTSVYRQDYGPPQVVVIEDGTPQGEDSMEICQRFPVTYIYRAENQGVMACRREGAQHLSDVDYLAFLDQDDIWHDGFLTAMAAVLAKDPGLGFVASNARLTDQGGNQPLFGTRVPSLQLEDLKVANQLISPSQVLIRMKAWESLDLGTDLRGGADDWLVWLAILALGYRAAYVSEMLLDYRVHAGGAHNIRRDMIASERRVVDEWFLKLGFTRADQRRFYGRVALDGLVQGIRLHQRPVVLQSVGQAIRDPWAFFAAYRFRRRHKAQGLV
ncbi:MAG: glycosyltransferase family 2 protein [Sulfobacillus benefaciens]|uniref:Glycosyltransferase family 2 protein n=1 Tax=Sulfobacillus benefaciens TaxID=453960 RepID=A0A2T2XIR4_9FIRM|nr:MAG: glycosyltransferase family 2 protein [Sulfobacillus benefaciens]